MLRGIAVNLSSWIWDKNINYFKRSGINLCN